MGDIGDRRVHVVLPDGHVLDGQLQARRRDPDGRWWYGVTVELPAKAVEPVPGKDYSQVPTTVQEHWPWLIQAPAAPGEAPVLHVGDCAAATGRLEPVQHAELARGALVDSWATVCDVCRPAP
ncbi:DUF6233 domain-containing protein [Streptomyces sp. NBC_00986]|uniref:DUF6233 domain-containing protein n=1 Tax=Streptomyces sp. NBC_00986 TaxID=2903702 RepID=UPI00386555E4|nr:DUF6233 domain-containing protein [Streptomyces sp. NBC_00986]